MLVAKYTAKASGVRPTFNSGYQYTVNETVSNGIYTVEIDSDTDFTKCSFQNKTNLLTVEYLKVTNLVTSMSYMFEMCSNLTQLDLSNWDTSRVKDMSWAFHGCPNLAQLDVSNWDTSQVTDMSYMFYDCTNLKTLTCNNMIHSNPKLFTDAINNGYITELIARGWVINVSSLLGIFKNNTTIQKIDASNWDTSQVINMAQVFHTCSSLTQLDVSNWDTSNVTSMNNMFYSCSNLTQLDLSEWDTREVTDIANMFQNCSSLAQLDVSNWDTSEVTSTNSMFRGCTSLTQLDVSDWDTSKVTNMSYMFQDCSSLTQLDVSDWDTSQVTNMNYMFNTCLSLTHLDINNWDTSKVTTMIRIFYECSSLAQLDLSNWDTSKVTDMYRMFRNCSSLTQLDLSNWDTSQVTDTEEMLGGCLKLKKIKLLNSNFPQLSDQLPTRTSDNPGYLFSYEEIPNEKNWNTFICKDFKAQIELPQPLRRIGDVIDRLYWDYDKGHYCIEKNIEEIELDITNLTRRNYTTNSATYVAVSLATDFFKDFMNRKADNVICNADFTYLYTSSSSFYIGGASTILYDQGGIVFKHLKSKYPTSEALDNHLKSVGILKLIFQLETPEIIDLPSLDKRLDIYEEATIINSNTIVKPVVNLETLIVKLKPVYLGTSTKYTVVFNCYGTSDITIDLGGTKKVITPSATPSQVKVEITTSSTLTNEYLSIYGLDGVVNNVMLLTKTPIKDIDYIDGIQSIGELQEDGSYQVDVMVSSEPIFFGKGGRK